MGQIGYRFKFLNSILFPDAKAFVFLLFKLVKNNAYDENFHTPHNKVTFAIYHLNFFNF